VTEALEVEEVALVDEVGPLLSRVTSFHVWVTDVQEVVEVEDEVDSQVTDHPIPSRVSSARGFDMNQTNSQRSDPSYTPSNPRCYVP
jgi:hypothetical protein